MRGVYTVATTIASFTTGDCFYIEAPANEVVELHEVRISVQNPTADEELDISVHRNNGGATGGTTITAEPVEEGDQAFGGEVRVSPTGQTDESAAQHRESVAQEAGWRYQPAIETRKTCQAAAGFTLTVNNTITSGLLIINAEFREIG